MAQLPFIDLAHFAHFFTARVTIEKPTGTTSATGQRITSYAALAGHSDIPACKWLKSGNEQASVADADAVSTHTVLLQGAFPTIRETMRARVTQNDQTEIYDILIADTDALGVATTLEVKKVR